MPPSSVMRFYLTIVRSALQFLPPPVAGVAQRVLYPTDWGRRRGGSFVRRGPTGSRLAGSLSEYHGFSSGMRGYSEWRLLAIAVGLVRPGDLIVEVGANVGTETIGYSDIVGARGRVVAFEPNPDNVAKLRAGIAFARHQNVEVVPVALGREAASVRFALPESGGSSGTGHLLGPAESVGAVSYYGRRIDADVVDVACRALDDYAEQLGRVTMLAIDAEGAEVSILEGGTRLIERDRPAIVVEASEPHLARAGHGVDLLFARLRGRGYRVYEISHTARLRELDRHPADGGSGNWLCLHESVAPSHVAHAARALLFTALLPMIPGLNPLTRPRLRE